MAPSLPDFHDTTRFPSFLNVPEHDGDTPASASSAQGEPAWYLVAQVKDNMTINKPTLVLTDLEGNPFALVFEGLERDALDLKGLGFKKGCTAVIPNARRTRPAEEGKRGFVRIDKGHAASVRAVPGPLARVLEVGGKTKGDRCDTCGGEAEAGLKGCTGCERVAYCSKVSSYARPGHIYSLAAMADDDAQECQVRGWSDGGHKNDCKMFKALNDIFK